MKISYILTFNLFLTSFCFGQIKLSSSDYMELVPNSITHKLSLQGSEDSGMPDRRTFLFLNNTKQSAASLVNIQLKAGTSTSSTFLTHASSMYGTDFYGSEYADFGQLWSSGTGLIVRAGGNFFPGVIKFQTGITPLGASNERMRIHSNGYVGIGTNSPSNILTVQSNAGNGSSERFLMLLNNISNAPDAGAILKINAGTGGSGTIFSHHSPSYSLKPSFNDNGQVFSQGKGLLIRTGSISYPNASIKFLTGNNIEGSGNERMRINEIGNVGIGDFDQSSPNNTPKSKLHIQNGDVYIENNFNGVILKSPNGNCYRLSVNDSGQIISSYIPCPN